MNKHRLMKSALVLACSLAFAAPGYAQQYSASDLGKSLTAVGAVRAGNAAGTIPAWTGGLHSTPANVAADFKPGSVYPDPFASDKSLFTITASNVNEYAKHLTPGQLAMFKTYPDYKIIVYPTHRTAAYPEGWDKASIANAVTGRAKLAPGNGDGVVGTTDGVPFPIPKNGLQAIWNELTRYRGESYLADSGQVAVTRSGDYTPVQFQFKLKFIYGAQTIKPSERTPNLLFYFIQQVTAPARLAGKVLLVREPLDQTKEQRKAWTYNPGQRRVRLAPNVAYDNPGTDSDGLRTNDDFNLFNGATDRYNWKLLGKREIYVPYNSYRINSRAVTYKDLFTPKHINQDYARYELHRVWVVQATLKPGVSHIYSKRTFYLDEDSWSPLLDEEYDSRGNLWRVSVGHTMQLWDVPVVLGTLEEHNDLQAGRYLCLGILNESSKTYVKEDYTAADFTPAALRQSGLR